MVLSLRKYPRRSSQTSSMVEEQLIYITRDRVTESVLENILECGAEPASGKCQPIMLQDFAMHQPITYQEFLVYVSF